MDEEPHLMDGAGPVVWLAVAAIVVMVTIILENYFNGIFFP